MYPDLLKFLEIPDLSVPSYFTMIAIGYLIAVWLFWREARRTGVDPDDTLDLAIWVIVWGVIGARLLHVLADGLFWDYVHLCTDPFLVEGRDLLGRPLSEIQELGISPRLCSSDAQCEAALWGFPDTEALEHARQAGELDGLCIEPRGRDVGPICNEDTGYCHPERDCFRWANFMAGGLAFYGGFLGATLFSVYFATQRRMGMLWAPKMSALPRLGALKDVPGLGWLAHFGRYLKTFPQGFLQVADMAAAPIALAHAFGRLGCFLGGCCFGAVTESPLAVRFPQWSAAYRQHRTEHTDALGEQARALGEQLSLPVHPTQLYEVGANLLIFAILFFVVRKNKRFHGHVFGVMLSLYAVARFTIEFFRDDARGQWLLGLSTSQLIALPLLGLGLWLLWRGRAHKDLIDDGQSPPLGQSPLENTQAPPASPPSWGGEPVAWSQGWPESQQKVLARIQGQAPSQSKDQEKQG